MMMMMIMGEKTLSNGKGKEKGGGRLRGENDDELQTDKKNVYKGILVMVTQRKMRMKKKMFYKC